MKKTIIDLFESSVSRYSGNTFLLEKTGGKFNPTTYAQARQEALKVGAGLAATGIKPKDMVTILAEGCNKWILSELGIFYAGGISVPLSVKLEEESDIFFRLNHAGVSAVMVSASQAGKVRAVRDRLPELKHIILFEGEAQGEGEITFDELVGKGEVYLEANLDEFLKIGQGTGNDDYATITYTSGTTADPKGVILTHRNYTANVEQSLSRIDIPDWYRTLIILPLDHCFAHVVGFYIIIACGAAVATVQVGKTPIETLKNIPLNISEVRPHFLLSVPALAKTFRKSIESSIRAKGPATERLFRFALSVSYAYNKDGYLKGSGAAAMLSPLVKLFDRILYSKIRAAFGGELLFFIGGGALLDSELQRFFYAIGIPMYQGYGLSEATPVISTNSPSRHRFGSSGQLLTPLDLKILDEEGVEQPVGQKGEIVIKGENVMAGYWKNPVATAATVRDGWLYTGDMGYMSPEGFLYVLGRFKSLLIGSDGEKYSPEGIEEALTENSPYIDQVILYNNQSPYTVAVIVPNRTAIERYLEHHAHHGQDRTRRAVELIRDEINRYRAGGDMAGVFPERWLPAAFALADEPFSEQNGMVNSTLKVVRGKVEEHYKARIAELYTPEGKNPLNGKNLAVFS